MNAVSFVALALLVAACNSGSASPSASTSPSGSPSPTATASPSASDIRVELEAFARSYYEEASRAISTGDVSRLRALATPECSCQQLVRYVEGKWANGSIRGGQFVIERVGPAVVQPKINVVPVFRSVTAYEVLDRAGNVVERGPADPVIREDVYIQRTGDQWIVQNVVVPR